MQRFKNKDLIKKILSFLIIIVFLFNMKVLAKNSIQIENQKKQLNEIKMASGVTLEHTGETPSNSPEIAEEIDVPGEDRNLGDKVKDVFIGAISGALNGTFGLLLWIILFIPKMFLIVVLMILSTLFFGRFTIIPSPDLIFLNKVPLLDAMMFINPAAADKANTTEFIITISAWFRAFYLIAVGLLFLVLVYIAIKAMFSALGNNLAEVKEMLTNWLQSILILVMLSMIIVSAIYTNNILVNILKDMFKGNSFMQKQVMELIFSIFSINLIAQIGGLLMLAILVRKTVSYAYLYVQRIIKIGFYILIAPFIAVSYTFDKMKDKKAQALTYWTQQFLSTVFIQPIHALVFVTLMSVATSLADIKNGSVINPLGIFSSLNVLYIVMMIVILNYMETATKEIMKMLNVQESISDGDAKKFGGMVFGTAGFKIALDVNKKLSERYKAGAEDRNEEARERIKSKLKDTPNNQDSNLSREDLRLQRDEEIEAIGNSNSETARAETATSGSVTPLGQSNITEAGREALSETVRELRVPEVEFVNQEIRAGDLPRPGILRYADEKAGAVIDWATKNKRAIQVGGLGALFGAGGGFDEMTSMAIMGATAGAGIDKNKVEKEKEKKKRQKQEDKYIENVEKEAKNITNTLGTFGQLNGINMDALTEEGKNNIKAFFADVKDRVKNGDLKEDYKTAMKDLLKYLQEQRGMTLAKARTEASRILNQAKQGKLNINELQSEQEKNFASLAAEKAVADATDAFKKKYELVKGDYEDVENHILKQTEYSAQVRRDIQSAIEASNAEDRAIIEQYELELKEINRQYDEFFKNEEKVAEVVQKAKQRNVSREEIEKLYTDMAEKYKVSYTNVKDKLVTIGVSEPERYLSDKNIAPTLYNKDIEKELQKLYADNAQRTIDDIRRELN